MEKAKMITCTSCGARFSAESDYCELCGWPVGQDDHDMKPAKASPTPASEASSPDAAHVETTSPATDEPLVGTKNGVFCHICGWQNPPDAKFCSDCGTRLQEATRKKKAAEKPAAESADTSAASNKTVSAASTPEPDAESVSEVEVQEEASPLQSGQMGMLVAAGVMVVAVLYMITLFSRRAFPEVEPAPAQAQTTQEAEAAAQANQAGAVAAIQSNELTGELAARMATLEDEAATLSGDALVSKKREMVSLLAEGNRPDKAAPVQEEIAGLTGAAEDWFSAGHFYYDWMDGQSGETRFAVAQRAATAYEEGLKQSPDDLNVRTALAMTYLNTRAPMQGVQQIRSVLETDPDHLQGNFYYGVMLLQINRVDQARTQFERVKELTGPETTLYQQADMMLQNLNG